MTDLRTLAQRCIDAPGSETDAAILDALTGPHGERPLFILRHKIAARLAIWECPRFTSSMDAAMTLVPGDYALAALKEGEAGCWFASLRPRNWIAEWRHGEAQSPAQAICAAALIARSET